MEFEFKDIKYDYGKFKVNTNKLYTKLELDTFLNDRYTKDLTYSKTELNNLITTPNVSHVTVPTYASLPSTGSANTIYRVSNYNGSTSQVDASVYSEYAWDGNDYVFLHISDSTSEVFDISVYKNNTAFANLSEALGTNGVNVPVEARLPGMSIKFILSSDNKYIQARLIDDAFTTDVNAWQIMDFSLLNREVLGELTKDVVWTPGYINSQGTVNNSQRSQFTQPFLLKKGETVTVGTINTNITIIGTTQQEVLTIGDVVTPIKTTSITEMYEEYSYTAQEDIKIVVCVLASDYNMNFYYSKNSSYMLNNMDDEPTEDSQMLVKSGGVYNAFGRLPKKVSVVSGQSKVLLNKRCNFGSNIAISLKSMTCTLASGKGIGVSFYKSDGSIVYGTFNIVGETIKRSASEGVTFTGIYIAILADTMASSGDVEYEVLWGNAYDSIVSSEKFDSKIEEVRQSQDSQGRELINNSVVAKSGVQLIGSVTRPFGDTNKVALRVVYNNATLTPSCKLKAALYNNGTVFAILSLSDKWTTFYNSFGTLVETVYVTCDGQVTKSGDICIEVAYGDYFRSAVNPIVYDLGSVELGDARTPAYAGMQVYKMFSHPLPISEFSKIIVKSSEFTLGEGADQHPSVLVYGIFSSDKTKINQLPSFSEFGKIAPVYAYENKYLYGILFINYTCPYTISFDAQVIFEDTVNNIPSIAPFDNCLQLPVYYNDYLIERKKLIRGMLRKTIIDGDVFYFVTDTHWEYNQKNSPAIINALSELCIPRLFHGGDMYHRGLGLDKYNTKCLESFRKALRTNKVYEIDGNHEYADVIANCADVFAETRLLLDDANFGGGDKNYYFIDNTQKSIRYVILYVFTNSNGSISSQGLCDRAQMEWFKNTALNVEEGYSIFVFTHYICSRRPYGMPGGIYSEVPMLDASDELNFYRIINEYSGNGNIVACICGHTHWDCVSQNKCTCPIICTTSDHNYPFYQIFSGAGSFYDFMDLIERRDSGTIKEQAFDTVIYDKDNSMLHLVRIGSRAMNRNNAFDGDAQVDIRTIVLTPVETGNTITLSSEFVIATWETSDSNVASVSNGVVTANADGYVVITGTASDDKKQSWFIKIAS